MRLLPRYASVIALVLACAASAGAGEAARGEWKSKSWILNSPPPSRPADKLLNEILGKTGK